MMNDDLGMLNDKVGIMKAILEEYKIWLNEWIQKYLERKEFCLGIKNNKTV